MLSDEYIRKLENEVRDISFKLKYASTFNNVELLKFLKKSLITVKYFIPYIVTSSLTFGLFSILGYTPFILDKREEYSYTLYEFDNSGNYSENNVITTDIVDNNIYVYNYDSNLLSLDKYIANYSFDEIVVHTKECLRSQINKEHLEKIFSYNVSNEQNIVARAVPLFLKNMAIRLVYTKSALANTTTITNIGNISVQKEYEPYIEMFSASLSMSKGQELKGTIASYKDTICYTFSTAWQDTAIPRRVFKQMASDGLNIIIETNGVFNQ